jgi:uncharacterized protein (TIRG00374 family)
MTSQPVKRRFGPLLLRVAFSLALCGWLATRVDWAHVAEAFRDLRWELWLGAVGIYVVCQLLCVVRWMWLSRPLGFTQSLGRFSAIYFVGMFFNLLLPTSVGGDAVRAIYLAKGTGRRMNALLSVLLDRVSGLVVLIALACVAAGFSPVPLPPQFKIPIWILGTSSVIGLILLPEIARVITRTRLAGSSRFAPIASKVQRMGEATLAAVKVLRSKPTMLVGATVISIVVQVLNAALVWLVGIALCLDVSPVYYGVAVPMVTLLTLIPVSLNGVGIREGGMVLFLAHAGVTTEKAITLAFLWFCVQSTTSLLGAAVYLIGHFRPPEGDSGEASTFDRRTREGRVAECVPLA